jgi:hypothetical protein
MRLIDYFKIGILLSLIFIAWIVGIALPLVLACLFSEWWLLLYLIFIPVATTFMVYVDDNV